MDCLPLSCTKKKVLPAVLFSAHTCRTPLQLNGVNWVHQMPCITAGQRWNNCPTQPHRTRCEWTLRASFRWAIRFSASKNCRFFSPMCTLWVKICVQQSPGQIWKGQWPAPPLYACIYTDWPWGQIFCSKGCLFASNQMQLLRCAFTRQYMYTKHCCPLGHHNIYYNNTCVALRCAGKLRQVP